MTQEKIAQEILGYILKANPGARNFGAIPMDQSLLGTGILDSFGIVELVVFIENRWGIQIFASEINQEQFGGISKMAKLVMQKI